MAALFLLSGHKPSAAPGVKLVKATEAAPFLRALELSAAIAAKEAEMAK